jgi:hypothetical protein
MNFGSTYSVAMIVNADVTLSFSDYVLGVAGYNIIRFSGGGGLGHSILVGGNSSGSATFGFTSTIPTFQTCSLILVRTGALCLMYINGILVGSATSVSGTNNSGAQYTIGYLFPFNGTSYSF